MSTLSAVVSLFGLLMLYIYLGLGPSLLRISREDHLSYFLQMPIQLPADANLSSSQIKLISDWNEGFLEMNVEILGKHLHKDFRRLVYPRSLGEPEQNKAEWLKEITGIMSFGIGSTTTHSIIEAPGRVVAHTTSGVKNSSGRVTNHESLFIVHIVPDEDGSMKIKQLDIFRDSQVYSEFSQSMGRR